MNLFTQNSPYYHLLKYLLLLLKHPVCIYIYIYTHTHTHKYIYIYTVTPLTYVILNVRKNDFMQIFAGGCKLKNIVEMYFAYFMFFVPCNVIQLCNVNQQNAHFFILMF